MSAATVKQLRTQGSGRGGGAPAPLFLQPCTTGPSLGLQSDVLLQNKLPLSGTLLQVRCEQLRCCAAGSSPAGSSGGCAAQPLPGKGRCQRLQQLRGWLELQPEVIRCRVGHAPPAWQAECHSGQRWAGVRW